MELMFKVSGRSEGHISGQDEAACKESLLQALGRYDPVPLPPRDGRRERVARPTGRQKTTGSYSGDLLAVKQTILHGEKEGSRASHNSEAVVVGKFVITKGQITFWALDLAPAQTKTLVA